MRVSSLLVLSCLFMSYVAAANGALRGRKLHGDKDESNSEQGFTDKFCMGDECHAPKPEFDGANLAGLIIGFVVTGLFMIFGVIVIIRDEINRMHDFREQLVQDRDKLRRQGIDDGTLAKYDGEFMTRETAKKKTAEELERERQELMAKN